MVKGFMVTVCVFAQVVFAFNDDVCILPIDLTQADTGSSTYIPTPPGYRAVIYDDQTYDYVAMFTALNITSPTYKLADDFEVYEDWTLGVARVWIPCNDGPDDIVVEIFGDSGDGPDEGNVLFTETVPGSAQIWTDTGDEEYGYTIWEVDIPISGFEVVPGTRYWLCLQYLGGRAYWAVTKQDPAWWDVLYTYINGTWRSSYDFIGLDLACFFELYGVHIEYTDPEITETYPHDSDFPCGIPVDTDITFHVTDDLSGCDIEETTINVEYEGDTLIGLLTFDDSDLLDVTFEWEPDIDYPDVTEIHVSVQTYDLAGNGPVTEEWSFTTGYVNIKPSSLGAIKAAFAE
jgi:hypothetical protein